MVVVLGDRLFVLLLVFFVFFLVGGHSKLVFYNIQFQLCLVFLL